MTSRAAAAGRRGDATRTGTSRIKNRALRRRVAAWAGRCVGASRRCVWARRVASRPVTLRRYVGASRRIAPWARRSVVALRRCVGAPCVWALRVSSHRIASCVWALRITSLRGRVAPLGLGACFVARHVAAWWVGVASLRGRISSVRGRVALLRGCVASLRGRVASLCGRVAALRGRVALRRCVWARRVASLCMGAPHCRCFRCLAARRARHVAAWAGRCVGGSRRCVWARRVASRRYVGASRRIAPWARRSVVALRRCAGAPCVCVASHRIASCVWALRVTSLRGRVVCSRVAAWVHLSAGGVAGFVGPWVRRFASLRGRRVPSLRGRVASLRGVVALLRGRIASPRGRVVGVGPLRRVALLRGRVASRAAWAGCIAAWARRVASLGPSVCGRVASCRGRGA
jgi:hypothetical protein